MSISRATHSGQLAITNVMLPCFVLDEGTRVLSQEGMLRAFGRSCQAKAEISDVRHPPTFLAHENLKPFISDELRKDSTPVHFRTEDGDQAFGYRAQVLPGVCNVYLSVRDAGKLRKAQKTLALLSCKLVRELATLGVIALIDVASNYCEALCHSPAVQGLLARYLKPFAASRRGLIVHSYWCSGRMRLVSSESLARSRSCLFIRKTWNLCMQKG